VSVVTRSETAAPTHWQEGFGMTQARRTITAGALAVLLLAAWRSPRVLPPLLAQQGGYGGYGGGVYGAYGGAAAPPAVVDLTPAAATAAAVAATIAAAVTAAAADTPVPAADPTARGTTVPAAATDPLAARLGGIRAGFETAYGPPADGSADDAARYAVRGYRRVDVTYAGDRAVGITLVADRPPDAPRDEPAAGDWGLAKAEELARRFLPPDAEVGDPRRPGDRPVLVTGCASAALAAAADGARCRVRFRLSGEDRVWAVELAVAARRAAEASPTAA
jgi:hypothetical protein